MTQVKCQITGGRRDRNCGCAVCRQYLRKKCEQQMRQLEAMKRRIARMKGQER